MKLIIFGSCVSRDAIEYSVPDSIEIVGYFARSSFASLTSNIDVDEHALAKITSNFQRSMVRQDMSKEFWQTLERADFDLLLVDLIDERFAILQTSDKALHTLSNEYASARIEEPDEVIFPSTSIEKFTLWKEGWGKLIALLGERGMLHKLVVNRVYWAATDIQGEALPSTKAGLIEIANTQLDRMYDYIERQGADVEFLNYPRDIFKADLTHKWGEAPFHYQARTYRHTLSELQKLTASAKQKGPPN